ncbi:hypothetical protein [Actinomycetospora chiangmaiensis]|uniref:hypothetical protein n=1 Tax=Actinomycetospora chiangmaiensis TaxID=402650 RepID=UPI0003822D4C|nr:hypothetical protein [Actinomycetospora chiangmaiensis]
MDGERHTSTVPEGLPVLAAGRHRSPDRGSCVMEYVSVLAGMPWGDRPRCTDRTLAELAWRVNDDVRADARPALAELAPRLVGAVGRRSAADVVVAAVAEVALELAPGDRVAARVRRRARARLARRPRWPWLRAVARAVGGTGLDDAYLRVMFAVHGLGRPERDAARLRALHAATEAVRRHVGAREAPRPGPVATRPCPVPGGVGGR